MKRSLILVVFSLMIGLLLAFVSTQVLRPGKPMIRLLESKYDFGVIDEDFHVKHAFQIQNVGSAPLLIEAIVPSCGCTSAVCDKQAIEPGGHANLEVDYTGRATPNREQINVAIKTNDPNWGIAQISIVGDVRMAVFWRPKSVSFSCLHGESPHIDVALQSDRQLHVTPVSSPHS